MNERQAKNRAHPRCIYCESSKPCSFHAATSAAGLASAVGNALRERAGLGLADLMAAGFATLEDSLPETAHRMLAGLPADPLQDRLDAFMAQEELDSDDLREMAATALALALVIESQAEDGGEEQARDFLGRNSSGR